MHHLVQDEYQVKHRGSNPRGRVNPQDNRRTRSQVDYVSDGSEGRYQTHHRRAKKRSDGSVNYYDGNRTPSPVTYVDTKASILRRRKNYKPNDHENEDLGEVLRPSLPTLQAQAKHYSSLQDLSQVHIHQNDGLPFSKHNSTNSINQVHVGNQQQHSTDLRRQLSEPLGLSI
jgi:hypothetical protein